MKAIIAILVLASSSAFATLRVETKIKSLPDTVAVSLKNVVIKPTGDRYTVTGIVSRSEVSGYTIAWSGACSKTIVEYRKCMKGIDEAYIPVISQTVTPTPDLSCGTVLLKYPNIFKAERDFTVTGKLGQWVKCDVDLTIGNKPRALWVRVVEPKGKSTASVGS